MDENTKLALFDTFKTLENIADELDELQAEAEAIAEAVRDSLETVKNVLSDLEA